MEVEKFINKIPSNYTEADRKMLSKAFEVASTAHEGQTRANGQPYLTHCVGVAYILMDMHASPSMVAAGLLHDVLLDTKVSLEQLRKDFGETISGFVEDLTKITSLPQISRADQHPDERAPLGKQSPIQDYKLTENINEALRKMLLVIGDDIRVIVIKLADRLQNMRSLNALPRDRQIQIAQETLDIYAPLANRLGIWQIKWELEDLGFRYTNPNKYKEISDQIALRRTQRTKEIDNIIENLKSLLLTADVEAKIMGRPKHIYSIYSKMQRKGQNFEAIRDLRAVRIIVDDVASCYKVLGLIHTHFLPIPGEFDDYIASKKQNNYQSLHTTVIHTDGKPLEIQIRTWEMHQNAEYGIAAHWRYKESDANLANSYEQKISTMRNLLAWSQELEEQDLQDGLHTDILRDKVYVLTPKGDVIELPFGSTPIDFAYQVHTNIGHRCRGAKVNGKLVTLDYVLKTGEQVDVLTTKKGGPSRDWLNPNLGMVKSSRTRTKIKQWFKQQDRGQNLEHGKLTLEKEFKRLGIGQIDLSELLPTFNVNSIEDLYVGIGSGDISVGRVINRVAELNKPITPEEEVLVPSRPTKPIQADQVTIMGLSGMATTIAKCCNPMPGDQIIGYITRGKGVTIHRADCPNISRIRDKERLINVEWGEATQTFPIPIQISAYDRQGLMTDISTVISGESARLVDLSMTTRRQLVKVNMVLEINSLVQLSKLLSRFENIPNVIEAVRLSPG